MPCRVPKRRFSCGAPQHLTKNRTSSWGTLKTFFDAIGIPSSNVPLQAPNIPKNKKRLPPKQQSFYFGIKLPPQQERC